jgi:hypothetical protein
MMAFAAVSVSGQSSDASSQNTGWQLMANEDVAFAAQWAKHQHILAVYPSPEVFNALVQKATDQASADIQHVHNFTGYRQALNHFIDAFHDNHFGVSIALSSTKAKWPGFTAMYKGGHYETVGLEPDATSGHVITACDGKSMNAWVEKLAPYEAFIPGLESTRAQAAPLILLDQDSPFVPRPKVCIIDSKEVALDWKPVDSSKFRELRRRLAGQPDTRDRIEPFGTDSVWVSFENMAPNTPEDVAALNTVIRQMPGLRSKRLIVIDERNNGGGPYNWFMAFIRALYGDTYTDYYSRARLQIAAVYRVTPDILTFFGGPPGAHTPDAIPMPPDGQTFDPENRMYAAALAKGEPVLHSPVDDEHIRMPSGPGPNLVQAKIIVLTGYQCHSACIGFVDEMKRIPGVLQAGVETGVDSRTGTPFSIPLPSGNGSVHVPVMIRDGRTRNDNEPQKPDVVYHGDIQNTDEIKAWIATMFPANAKS